MFKIKIRVLILITAIVFVACSNNDDSVDLFGKWKLVEQLADPGDGSGVFITVNSNRTIEFFDDFTVVSNGALCIMSSETSSESTGTFFSTEESSSIGGTILPDDCEFSNAQIIYKVENNKLILSFLCIEACQQKFVKIL